MSTREEIKNRRLTRPVESNGFGESHAPAELPPVDQAGAGPKELLSGIIQPDEKLVGFVYAVFQTFRKRGLDASDAAVLTRAYMDGEIASGINRAARK